MGLLTSLFERRSLENPSTPLSAPDDWLFDSLGSFKASSGVNVNRETALTYDAYWRCVSLVSGDVAKLPLSPYQKTDKGYQVDEEHPSYGLVSEEASEEITALDWKRVMQFHALAEGNGYSYIIRDKRGRPMEIWPLSPMKTYPVRENRKLWYVTQIGSGENMETRKLPSHDVFHLKGLSFDGLVGYSAVAKMREAVGLGLAYENYGSIFFRNNAVPKVVLVHPGRLKAEAVQNLRESWERIHAGLENAHRTAVLQEGMTLQTITTNARDSQLFEGKTFSRVQICNFFGVPPHKVGDNSRTSYNSLEQENESYIEDGGGLGYWLPAWVFECRRKLLSDAEKEARSHCFRFNTRGLLRANLTARTGYFSALLDRGVLNPNEVREEEGYNPREGGDQYVAALNMQPSGPKGLPEPTPPGPEPERTPKPLPKPKTPSADERKLLADATRRMIHRLGGQAVRAARKPAAFMDWLDGFLDDQRSVMQEALGAPLRMATGLTDAGDRGVVWLLCELHADLEAVAGRTSAKHLEAEINFAVDAWEKHWPDRMARQGMSPGEGGREWEGIVGDPAGVVEDRVIWGIPVSIQVKSGQPQPAGHGENRKSPAVNDYGFVPGVIDNDGADLDVFCGPDQESSSIWVVDQLHHGGLRFNEHKTLLAFAVRSEDEARAVYLSNYDDPWHHRYGGAKAFTVDEFKRWMRNMNPKDPVAWARTP